MFAARPCTNDYSVQSCCTFLLGLPLLGLLYHTNACSVIPVHTLSYQYVLCHTSACSTIPVRALPYQCVLDHTSACYAVAKYRPYGLRRTHSILVNTFEIYDLERVTSSPIKLYVLKQIY